MAIEPSAFFGVLFPYARPVRPHPSDVHSTSLIQPSPVFVSFPLSHTHPDTIVGLASPALIAGMPPWPLFSPPHYHVLCSTQMYHSGLPSTSVQYHHGPFSHLCTILHPFTEETWEMFMRTFEWLPLAATIDDNIFCCHAGLPRAVMDDEGVFCSCGIFFAAVVVVV